MPPWALTSLAHSSYPALNAIPSAVKLPEAGVRESDAPIVIGPVEAGLVVPALGLLPLPLHAARTPTDSATAPMAMAFLENQGRLDFTTRFLLPPRLG